MKGQKNTEPQQKRKGAVNFALRTPQEEYTRITEAEVGL
jgi:hypothetical protein